MEMEIIILVEVKQNRGEKGENIWRCKQYILRSRRKRGRKKGKIIGEGKYIFCDMENVFFAEVFEG